MFMRRHMPHRSCEHQLVTMLIQLLLLLTTNHVESKTAVVVGGGPAGLASALVLSRSNTFDKVTIIEPDDTPSFDTGRAYFYNINKRGQRFTDNFMDLTELGVGVTQFARQNVPANPSQLFTGVPFTREMSPEERKHMGTMYWIPRHKLIQLLVNRVRKELKIQLCFGMSCLHVEPDGDRVKVVSTGSPNPLVTDLVVGADGLSSKVRQSLTDGRFEGWKNSIPSTKFRMRKWNSPSVGLRIKGLRLLPNFMIPVGNGTSVPVESNYNYAIYSQTTGATDALKLTLLPQKKASDARPINICTPPNHQIWTITDGLKMKEYFTKAFPRFDWNQIVASEEWEIFAKAKGSKFPECQYSPRMHVSSGTSGVVLVGDAIHAFPPDLGQGVNAAFCDVVTLGKCLQESSSIPVALENYEKENVPESRALIELARCGAPFQYDQPSRIMKFRKTLWTMNVALRILLNKITKGIAPKPAILMMMNSSLSFKEIMAKANTLTFVLWTCFATLLFKISSTFGYLR